MGRGGAPNSDRGLGGGAMNSDSELRGVHRILTRVMTDKTLHARSVILTFRALFENVLLSPFYMHNLHV